MIAVNRLDESGDLGDPVRNRGSFASARRRSTKTFERIIQHFLPLSNLPSASSAPRLVGQLPSQNARLV